MKNRKAILVIAICFTAWLTVILQYKLYKLASADKGGRAAVLLTESDMFRSMNIDREAYDFIIGYARENSLDWAEVLTFYMLDNSFDLSGKKTGRYSVAEYFEKRRSLMKKYGEEWNEVNSAYRAVFADIKYFPVVESSTEYPVNVSFGDGWKSERYYNDVMHFHEGTDIMANGHDRGYVPVVSMTEGVVENIGWLELGGYRIGIRSPNGGYFYYAHLYRYAKDFKTGDTVRAGELIGFMGDSGYGRAEGTVGNFAVHLHLGIYIKTKNYEELAVNPYAALTFVENSRVKCRLYKE